MDDMIHRFANLKQTPVSVKNMIVFGRDANMNTLLRSHAFLRCELPIRLAHIAKEITALPPELLEVEPVQKVLNWYRLSFSEVIESAVPNVAEMEHKTEDEQCASLHQFQDMLDHIKDRHAGVVTTMAEGVLELKNRLGREMIDTSVQFFLDRLYMNRISIRMLITQHLELFKQAQSNNDLCTIMSGASGSKTLPNSSNKKNRWVGVIDPQCNVKEIAEDAADDARYLCSNNYSVCPQVQIIVPKLGTQANVAAPTLPYVPSHLYHMLFETIKVYDWPPPPHARTQSGPLCAHALTLFLWCSRTRCVRWSKCTAPTRRTKTTCHRSGWCW
jgi:pyruvate dehydrogenase kinase 2/3/4